MPLPVKDNFPIYALSDVTGLTEWVDYIPVQLPAQVVDRRNLAYQTRDVSNTTYWTPYGATVAVSAEASPLGGVMDQITDNTTGTGASGIYLEPAKAVVGTFGRDRPTLFSNGKTVTLSLYAKAGTHNYVSVGFGNLSYDDPEVVGSISTYGYAVFDLATGTITATADSRYYWDYVTGEYADSWPDGETALPNPNVRARIEDMGSGVYRCSVTFDPSIGDVPQYLRDAINADPEYYEYMYALFTDEDGNTAATNGLTLHVDGWQVEYSDTPSEYQDVTTGDDSEFLRDANKPNTFDYKDGYLVSSSVLSDVTGLTAWVDYIPVYEVTGRTKPWYVGSDGYIPYNEIGSVVAWSPSALFASGEEGAWYDATTLADDNGNPLMYEYDGTAYTQTPVTAVGQKVHLWFDRSKDLAQSETNVVVNGGFDAASDWTLGAGWSISGGTLNFATEGSPTHVYQSGIFEVGKVYRITGTLSGLAGASKLFLYSGTTTTIPVMAVGVGNGSFDALVYAYTDTLYIRLGSGTTAATLDNIACYEIAGNHAVATTATTAPVLAQDGDGVYYLDYDGINDVLTCSSLDLSSTDQLLVAAVVNKASDSTGTILSYGTSSTSNGLFLLYHSLSNGPNYYARSRGTVASNVTSSALYPFGSKDIIISQSEISADFNQIEVNGNFAGMSTTDQGTGNYGTYTLSLGFLSAQPYTKADVYQIIVRGERYSDVASVRNYLATEAAITLPEPSTMPGVWTWFNDPRAIYANGNTYVGAVDSAGNVYVNQFGEGVSALGVEAADDHNNPALLHKVDGHIQAFWTGHNVAGYQTAISTNANDATSFGAATNIDSSIGYSNYAYAHPFQLDGMANDPIYVFFRATIGADLTRGFTVSTDNGATWSAGTRLLDWGGRPYLIASQSSDTRIDFVVTDGHPAEVATNSIYHFYFDNGDWFDSAGTDIGDPPFAKTSLTKVYDAETPDPDVRAWNWGIEVDSTGAPCILYATFPSDTDHRYNFARWNGTSWDLTEICAAGTYLYVSEPEYSGGVCMNPENPFEVIASRESAGSWTLWKYTSADNGATWSGAEIIDDGATHQFRPTYIRGKTTEPKIAYVSGTYTSYTSYATCSIKLASTT